MLWDRGIIVSCQPRMSGYFTEDAWKFAGEAQFGGAVALRIEGLENISKVCDAFDLPVIGLVKYGDVHEVRITPKFSDAFEIVKCGADCVAADATGRDGLDELKKMIRAGYKVVADIATFEQARQAEQLGCFAITTALAGYTDDSFRVRPFDQPHLGLVKKCAQGLSIPVIAEGRYFETSQVQMAFDCGAHSVCIGAAITLPDKITKRFAELV